MKYYEAVGAHVQRADLATVKDIDVPVGATHVLFQAVDQNVRYTLDGSTAPTATKGLLVQAGDPPQEIPVPVGGTIKAIEAAATATADYQFIARI